MTMRKAALLAKEEKNFSPSSTHSFPSRQARVRKVFGSAPPWGSVME